MATIPAEHKRLYEYIKDVLRVTRAQFAEANRESQLDDADYAAALVLAFNEGDNSIDYAAQWGVRLPGGGVRYLDRLRGHRPMSEIGARNDGWRNGLPLISRQAYGIDIEFPWAEVPNPLPEPPKPEYPKEVVPSEENFGRVARVRLPSQPESDERTYVAEVRKDYGHYIWSGSWAGFALRPFVPVTVLEWLA